MTASLTHDVILTLHRARYVAEHGLCLDAAGCVHEERTCRADEMIAAVPAKQCRRTSAGDGAHGPREYSWA